MTKVQSISELLGSQRAGLKALQEGAAAADRLLSTVRSCLQPAHAQAVWSASSDGGRVTLLVQSPAMATRLHYELPALRETLATRLGEPVDKILLRVRPNPTGP